MKFAYPIAAPIAAVAVTALALAGCAHKGRRMANRNTPDEFAISRSAPLIVPPDFALTPPKPGAARALADDAQTNAAEALFGPGVKITPRSPAENNLLDKAGATKPEASIRSSAGDPETPTVNKGAFLRELMAAPAKTLDPNKAVVTFGS